MRSCGKISTANRNADKMGRYLNKGAFRYFLDIFDLPTLIRYFTTQHCEKLSTWTP